MAQDSNESPATTPPNTSAEVHREESTLKRLSDLVSELSGEALFWRCQRLAERRYPATSGQAMLPSGARIFYFTRLALLRQEPLEKIELDENPLPTAQVRGFLELAPGIAKRLAEDYKHALRLLDPKQSDMEMRRLLRSDSLVMAPRLSWASEHLVGIYELLRQRWQALWRAYWRRAESGHLEKLRSGLYTDSLLVTSVAPPAMTGKTALKKLHQQLEQDRMKQAWVIPPPDMYLYDEPLDDWLMRPLLSGKLFFELCQVLAELASAVPTLVRSRAAAVGMKADDGTSQQEDTLKQEIRRRVPSQPRGTATAEAIFYYTVSAWRASADLTNDKMILPDERLLSPRQFQTLIELAIKATERIMWDDTLGMRVLPAQAPERRNLLRQMLLPPQLHRLYEALNKKVAGAAYVAVCPPHLHGGSGRQRCTRLLT